MDEKKTFTLREMRDAHLKYLRGEPLTEKERSLSTAKQIAISMSCHPNTNNQNALRGPVRLDEHLRIRISADLKTRAQEAAKERGVSLSQMVCDYLESVT